MLDFILLKLVIISLKSSDILTLLLSLIENSLLFTDLLMLSLMETVLAIAEKRKKN